MGPRKCRMGSGEDFTMRSFIVYRSLNIVRVIKSRRLSWTGHVARMEEDWRAFKILIGKPIGKRPLGRPRPRREDNIKMDLKEIGINTWNWVDLTQDRNYWIFLGPQGSISHRISWSALISH